MRRAITYSTVLLVALVLTACSPSSAGPTAWIDEPLDGSKVPVGPVTVLAHASDADGVATFEFFVNDILLVTAPGGGRRLDEATVEWTPSTPGTYTVCARAIDSKGNVGSEAKSVVIVGELAEASPMPGPIGPHITPSSEPQITFTANPTKIKPGECATLRWSVQGAEVAQLNGQPVELSGQNEVCPEETTTYTLAVYVGQGPPKGEREVVISVEGAAPLTPTPTITPTPTPTTLPVCPSPPVIPYFTADPGTITAGESSTLSWGLVTYATNVEIDQGIGQVGTPASTVVTPATKTTYTMTATGCGGTTTKQVTLVVNPAPVFTADLAMTDLYPETPNGPVYGRLTNNGPGNLINVTIQFSCQWDEFDPIENVHHQGQIGPSNLTIVSLNPGQTTPFNTSMPPINRYSFQYDITCTIYVPFNDPSGANNSYSETFPCPP